MFNKIYKAIKKYNNIVITRHISADVDALGAQIALKNIILNNFPKKKVYAIGAYSSKFKYMGTLDKENDEMYKDSLLIVLDTPIKKRIDMQTISDMDKYSYRIKIDHHPFDEEFCDIEYIDDNSSSTCEIILDLCKATKLKLNKYTAERLFLGIVFDTNRFLYPCASTKTMRDCAELLDKYEINKTDLYEQTYIRNLDEIRFQGYIFQNIKVTENGVGYICISDEIQKQFGVDPASAGNMVGYLTFIDELLVWLTFSEDKKQDTIRVSVRSRGPAINGIAMQYNGGGHKLASGIRIDSFDKVDEIIEKFDQLCLDYKEEQDK